MANPNPLALAWVVYALASVLLIIVGWRVTRNWRPVVLGRLLRVWLAVLLMTPAYVEAGINAVAPAWVVTLFIAAGDGLEAARIGWLPLAAALALSTAVILVGALVQQLRAPRGATRHAN